MTTLYHAASRLQEAAIAWESAVEDIQDALSDLRDVALGEIPEELLAGFDFRLDGGLNAYIQLACCHEPDLTPPQRLRELAESLTEVLDCEDE